MPTAADNAPTRTAKVIGHRGAARIAPENTLKAFRAGIAAGAQLLECDVHLSADGQLVIMHDASIDRTAEENSPLRTGKIADLTRAELDTVRLPGGEAVPSLAQVLDIAQAGSVPIYVEVKAPAAADQTAQLLLSRGLGDEGADAGAGSTSIISFSMDALRTAREVAPRLPLVAVTKTPDQDYWDGVREVGALTVSLPIKTLTDEDVATVREKGLQLNVWTVDEEDQFRRAVEVGADTITTDDPGWALEALAQI